MSVDRRQNMQTPRKALNKAYLKLKPCREQVDLFKRELQKLIQSLLSDVQPLESRIDHLVCRLTNLTPEEIAIVGGDAE